MLSPLLSLPLSLHGPVTGLRPPTTILGILVARWVPSETRKVDRLAQLLYSLAVLRDLRRLLSTDDDIPILKT
ncbi:hypothetical protein F4808DRAFT_98118 [Astrocystis sublimbata]|nr:hypothetical protein F4808DRAFT_98118 [Astrocystis sublimbata]